MLQGFLSGNKELCVSSCEMSKYFFLMHLFLSFSFCEIKNYFKEEMEKLMTLMLLFIYTILFWVLCVQLYAFLKAA